MILSTSCTEVDKSEVDNRVHFWRAKKCVRGPLFPTRMKDALSCENTKERKKEKI